MKIHGATLRPIRNAGILRAERDALIAATALAHGLTVVTRNVVDFTPLGVLLLNPWLEQPAV